MDKSEFIAYPSAITVISDHLIGGESNKQPSKEQHEQIALYVGWLLLERMRISEDEVRSLIQPEFLCEIEPIAPIIEKIIAQVSPSDAPSEIAMLIGYFNSQGITKEQDWSTFKRKIGLQIGADLSALDGWPSTREDRLLEMVAAAYEIIAYLTHEYGIEDHPEVERALDALGDPIVDHKDLLPWPKYPITKNVE